MWPPRLLVPAFVMVGVTLGGERAASSAPAARTSARLAYVRESGAEQCPDESVLRDSVLTRLGYDPFDDRAPTLLVAVVRRSGDSLVARIELHDASGRVLGERDLRGSGTSCDELASAMAIALSLGIDPLSATATPPSGADSNAALPPTPSPPSASPPQPVIIESPAPEPPSTPPAREPSIRARLSGGALVSWGISPAAPAIGATLDAGIRHGRWSLDLEGAGSWAPTATKGSIGAKSSLELVSLVPCVHFWVGLGCAIGGVGSLNATGVVRFPQSDHAAFANVGVRLGAEIPFAERFYLQFHADGLATLTPETFHVDGQTFWNRPPVSASLGVAVGVVP